MDEQDRTVVLWVRGELISGESRLFDHVTSTFRWLMATLFAANGGALVALLDSGAHDLPGRDYALVWFALGIIASVGMGGLSTFFGMKAAIAINKMRAKLDECLITQTSPENELTSFVQQQQLTWKTWIPSYTGAASLGFFIIGLGTIAGSLIRAGL